MRAARDFDPADQSELEPFSFDFVNEIAAGDSIAPGSVPSFTAELVYGDDPDYASRVSGLPSVDGTVVSCYAGGFQPGCRYRLVATVVTTLEQRKTLFADVVGEKF